MYCKECGFQLAEDAKFCPNCGTKIDANGLGNIESNAVWGNIENDETEEDVSSQISSKANWDDNVSKSNNNGYNIQSSVEYRKIIRKQETSTDGIYVAFWSYENDNDSELSPQWYEDSSARRISKEYDYCSKGVSYDLTFVKKNSMWACCKLIDGRIKELTPFVFADFDLDFYKSQEYSKYNIEVYSIVLYNRNCHILDSNMRLYKVIHDWWSNTLLLLIAPIVAFFLAVDLSIWWKIGFASATFIYLLYECITKGFIEYRLKKVAEF